MMHLVYERRLSNIKNQVKITDLDPRVSKWCHSRAYQVRHPWAQTRGSHHPQTPKRRHLGPLNASSSDLTRGSKKHVNKI